jgi:hypothetical protein
MKTVTIIALLCFVVLMGLVLIGKRPMSKTADKLVGLGLEITFWIFGSISTYAWIGYLYSLANWCYLKLLV